MTPANWDFPTSVRIGPGRIAELADACSSTAIARPLVVTDPQLARQPMISGAIAALSRAGLGVDVFTDLQPNPVEANVVAGTAAYHAGGHDGVVAIGGGSALDVGKLVAFMAGQHGSIWEFEDIDDRWRLADAAAIAPVVAVPTTAGTGSEVGRSGVISDAAKTKRVIFHPGMLPTIVICDPELTVGLPRHLTVGTGMDALAHLVEAYCARGYHPMADGIAVEGIRLVFENLPVAARHPDDLDARQHMLAAAAMGATAFQKGLGAMHSLAHPIGAHFDVHHGTANAVIMPYVLAANRPAIEDRIDRLAGYLGIAGGFDGFLAAIIDLRRELGVPATLADLGVPAAARALVAAAAVADPTAAGNPTEVTRERAEALFDVAHRGTLA